MIKTHEGMKKLQSEHSAVSIVK